MGVSRQREQKPLITKGIAPEGELLESYRREVIPFSHLFLLQSELKLAASQISALKNEAHTDPGGHRLLKVY